MTYDYGLILDCLIIVLLAATIFYAAILNRRLSQLRSKRGELEGAVRAFAEGAAKADTAIRGLKETTRDAGRALQSEIDRAKALRDELSFLVDAGNALAVRLENAADKRLDQTTTGPTAAEKPRIRPDTEAPDRHGPDGKRRRAEPDGDLLRAIETMR